MSRIEDAVNGMDYRMREFLLSEGFEYNSYSTTYKWVFKTTDPLDRQVEVSIGRRDIYVVVYENDGSGNLQRSEFFYYNGYEEFDAAYQNMLEYLRS